MLLTVVIECYFLPILVVDNTINDISQYKDTELIE